MVTARLPTNIFRCCGDSALSLFASRRIGEHFEVALDRIVEWAFYVEESDRRIPLLVSWAARSHQCL